MSLDVEAVSALIREVAAETIMPRFDNLAADDIREKAPGDLVTIADIETEQALTPRLKQIFEAEVIGEEATAKDPGLLDKLLGGEGDFWIVDPIDGTSNFAAGMPIFAVMVALLRRGEIAAAWIYEPVSGHMTVAERGGGAWREQHRLSVARPTSPENMSGSVSLRYGNRQLVRRIAGRSNLVGSVFSFRCAGPEYLALASGRAHFALYHRLLPWDHAPGYLIHREAGGYGLRLDRSAFTPAVRDGGLLLTPDRESWESLHAVLIGK